MHRAFIVGEKEREGSRWRAGIGWSIDRKGTKMYILGMTVCGVSGWSEKVHKLQCISIMKVN